MDLCAWLVCISAVAVKAGAQLQFAKTVLGYVGSYVL